MTGQIILKYAGPRSGQGVLTSDSPAEVLSTIATLLDTTLDMVVEVRPFAAGDLPEPRNPG